MLTGALVAALAAVSSACGAGFPADPEGTLDRVRGGVLRVGVSADPPWTELPDGTGTDAPTGVEPTLLEEFARSVDAEVAWTVAGEEALVRELEAGRLDVVVGGLTGRSPWAEKVALTQPYVTLTNPEGRPEHHVMATPMGENGFLVALERFLLEQDVQDVAP
ncbi:transporter substrate-binding domain-containing protein [Cellulomonas sp. ATA003]|uniref:transporter substrate-binding domain-containing protein n=1 Tax=Cellulomonas sp. ATA003 TaxID=3073064 RepID=UPI002873AE95|nr:transporter substrate-binding domain-containing protein [Cellulomonas sp. ATA003]WNB86228.1 transporter substrate-binding domain-containing protein [Cellulomonas sp. ATA003]